MDEETERVSAFGVCWNKLDKLVDQIYQQYVSSLTRTPLESSTGTGSPQEAVAALAVPGGASDEGMTSSEIRAFCGALNARFIQGGYSNVFVSPDAIEEQVGLTAPLRNKSALGGRTSKDGYKDAAGSNKYCGEQIWGSNSELEMAKTLTKAVGDVCFYGCFAAVLYQSAAQRYDSVKDAFRSSVDRMANLLLQIIQSPGAWLTTTVDMAGSMLETLMALKDSVWSQAKELAEGKNFSELLWAYVKSYLIRYKDAIVLGIIQRQINQIVTALELRANYLQMLDQKMKSVAEKAAALAGMDWWKDLEAAVQKAMVQINNSDQALQRAQIGASTGQWDEKHLEQGQLHLVVAKNAISSVDMITDTLNELIGVFKPSSDPMAFRWHTGDAIKNDFIEDLKALGTDLDEMSDIIACLAIQTQKIESLSALIQLTARLLNIFTGAIELQASMDVTIDVSILEQTRHALKDMYDEMQSLLISRDRISAPGLITAWHAQLSFHILGLQIMNIYPDTQWLSPLGVGGYSQNEGAVATLQYILTSRKNLPPTALPDRDFNMDFMPYIGRFIASAGDLGLMLGNYEGWLSRLNSMRSQVREAAAKDRETATMCKTYSGYESEELDSILELLDEAGWKGAKKLLEEGKVQTFLGLGLTALSVGALMNCVAGLLDKEAPNIGITSLLNRELALRQAESIVAVRAPCTMPSFQFKLIQGLAKELRDIGSLIRDITTIKDEVC